MDNETFLFGIRPVVEAIMAGKAVDRILLRKGMHSEGFKELYDLILQLNIPIQYVPDAKLNSFTRKNHQGVIALMSLIEYADLEEVIEGIYQRGRDPFILLLDRITDVRNFGAIARTAECAGMDAIVIPEKGSARINAEAIKSSAGALMKIAICRSANIFRSATLLLQHGIKMVAATEKGKEVLYDVPFAGPLCIVMGSEEDGISAPLLKMSHHLVKIPQYGEIGSLNVSVAAGILIFEAARQRNTE